jgi:hypothetical protein
VLLPLALLSLALLHSGLARLWPLKLRDVCVFHKLIMYYERHTKGRGFAVVAVDAE